MVGLGIGMGVGYSPRKGGGFTTEGLFGPSNDGFYYDNAKTDGLFVLPNGPTTVAVDTDPLGLVLDRRLWGGKTLAQVREAQNEGLTNTDASGAVTGVVGSGGAWPATWFHSLAATGNAEIIGTGTEDGYPFVDVRFYGSSSSGANYIQFGANLVIAAVKDMRFWGSLRTRLAAGTLTNASGFRLVLSEKNSAGSTVSETVMGLSGFDPSIASTLDDAEVFGTSACTNAATAFAHLKLFFNAGGAYDFTIRVAAPSLKHIPGNHATSSGSTRPFWYDEGLGRGDAIDDTLLTTFTPAAAGNTIMARVTVPASLAFTQYVMGALTTAGGRIALAFTTAGYLVGGAGTVDGSIIRHEVDYRGQTGTAALTEDGTNWNLYWNGALVDTGAAAGAMTVTPLRLFCWNVSGAPSSFFGGDIYKIMAIDRALTPTEILNQHNLWSN